MSKLHRVAMLSLLLCGLAGAMQAKPIHLSAFHGVYRGTVMVTLSGRTYPGTARIVIQTGKKGRSATLIVSGTFRANGKSFPISNLLTFSRTRNFTERSITNGFAGASIGVAGKYIAHRHKLIFDAPFTINTTLGKANGTAAIRPGRRGKQVLALNTSIAFDGQPQDYFFSFQVSKYLEP